ncbi:FAD binding domain-containing protein [Maritimibacter fusiformis]|uniref:Xanthine dehydrogenase family protein subunit M n=1 Tax=Maritimibacter fusiformis TaxID=2603819 RepID=A0A5D0RI39_9RHOB|nr:FAD binding domain-containing protein [Maritimibacter fusiformis]TYB81192.1 xanthine dehydrogenase family protein subunit M [Maritimibacter fusiformis]
MKPAAFTFHRPGSVDEALALLAQHGAAAKALGGGQSLGPMLNMRLAQPEHLIDLNDLIELDRVIDHGEWVEVGALTRHHRVATAPEIRQGVPLLADAAATIGHYAIRQRGTLGGSLVQADPAAQLPLVAVTLGADVMVRSRRGRRTVAAAEFLRAIMSVDLAGDELVTGVCFPRQPDGERWAFDLFSRRHGDFAIVAVALTLQLDDAGAIVALRLGVGGVGPVPMRLTAVEQRAVGLVPDGDTILDLARNAAAAITPEDDPLVPAKYRRDLVETLTARALRRVTADWPEVTT